MESKPLLLLAFYQGHGPKVTFEVMFHTPIEVKSIDRRSTRKTYMHGTMAGKLKSARSAITNGSRLFAQRVDLRTSRGSRFKDLIDAYTHDAGNTLTEAQRAIVRDLAMLQVLAEDLQQRYMKTGVLLQEGQTQYARITNNMRRHMKTLGLTTQRVAKSDDEDLSPLDYMKRGRKRERLDDDEEDDDD